MGDVGDMWREVRAWKRDLRAAWPSCPDCEVAFGTGKKIPPGGTCPHHGWKAPGNPGDDVAAAERAQEERETREAKEEAEKAARREKRTCSKCRKLFGSPQAAAMHFRDAHERKAPA